MSVIPSDHVQPGHLTSEDYDRLAWEYYHRGGSIATLSETVRLPGIKGAAHAKGKIGLRMKILPSKAVLQRHSRVNNPIPRFSGALNREDALSLGQDRRATMSTN